MLSKDISMNRDRRHPEMLPQKGTEAGRVQNGTASITLAGLIPESLVTT